MKDLRDGKIGFHFRKTPDSSSGCDLPNAHHSLIERLCGSFISTASNGSLVSAVGQCVRMPRNVNVISSFFDVIYWFREELIRHSTCARQRTQNDRRRICFMHNCDVTHLPKPVASLSDALTLDAIVVSGLTVLMLLLFCRSRSCRIVSAAIRIVTS